MRRFRFACLAVIATALAPFPAWAQQDTASHAGPIVVAGVRIGFPQKAAAYAGVVLSRPPASGAMAGWSATVQPGLGGGLVGIGRTWGESGLVSRLQLAGMRTWGDPWLVGPDQTYVGVDAQFTIMLLGFAAGGFVRLPEEGADPGALFSLACVIGV